MYRRYAIVAEADLSEGVAKLAELHGSGRKGGRTVEPLRGTLGAHSAAGGG